MIGWYVHHHGLGHVTRALAVAQHLRTPVTGLSSLPRPEGWPGPWLQLARDDDGPARDDPSDPTAHGVLHWVPLGHDGLAGRTAQVTAWVRDARPSLVVVDVSVEMTLLTRLTGTPVVVVAMPGARSDRAHRLAYDVAEGLLAPWPPDAHTTGWPAAWRDKVTAVGGISRFDGRPRPGRPARRGRGSPDRPRRVLLLWGAGGTGTTADAVAAARAATPGWDWLERGPGSPSPDLWSELAAADVVVTHAGQNAVAEVAAAGRPAVVVPQPRPFDEQGATAAAVDRLGVAVGLRAWPSEARLWPDLLERAVRVGGDHWDRWSTGRGAVAAAGLLDGLVQGRADGPSDRQPDGSAGGSAGGSADGSAGGSADGSAGGSAGGAADRRPPGAPGGAS